MKMIYAGPTLSSQAVPSNYLFNCLRNPNCQRDFFVPLRSLSDLFLYFEFPFGKPVSFIIQLIDCDGTVNELSFCNYVIARRPDGLWYGIFTGAIDEGLELNQFRLEAQFFSASETSYKYFSEQLQIDPCDGLMKIEACYPIPDDLTRAYDCNGIYYGIHTGETAAAGNTDLRYFHFIYVRRGSVIKQTKKMELTLFNNRLPYRNIQSDGYLLQSELIPTFYMDWLAGVIGRGRITVDGSEYTLDPAQEFSILDESSKLWPPDVKLLELCRQFFGCAEAVCEVGPAPCENLTTVEITNMGYAFSGGTLNDGESISWVLKDSAGEELEAGETFILAANFETPIDLDENCYTFEWIKNCLCSLDAIPSIMRSVVVGNCAGCPDVVVVSAAREVIPGVGNSVIYLSYSQYPSGESPCQDQVKITLKTALPVAMDTEFIVKIMVYTFAVDSPMIESLTMLAGTDTVSGFFFLPTPCDSTPHDVCVQSCSDLTIDLDVYECP